MNKLQSKQDPITVVTDDGTVFDLWTEDGALVIRVGIRKMLAAVPVCANVIQVHGVGKIKTSA